MPEKLYTIYGYICRIYSILKALLRNDKLYFFIKINKILIKSCLKNCSYFFRIYSIIKPLLKNYKLYFYQK